METRAKITKGFKAQSHCLFLFEFANVNDQWDFFDKKKVLLSIVCSAYRYLYDKVWEGGVRRLERRLEKVKEEGDNMIPITSLK